MLLRSASACSFKALPAWLSATHRLTHLEFVMCTFVDEPASSAALGALGALPGLRALNLICTGLHGVGAAVCTLAGLTQLFLNTAALQLPPGRPLGPQLRQLALQGPLWHPYRAVPRAVAELPALTALMLSGVGLRRLAEGPYLAGMRFLDLSYNEASLRCAALRCAALLTSAWVCGVGGGWVGGGTGAVSKGPLAPAALSNT